MKNKDRIKSSVSSDELKTKINDLNDQLVKLRIQKSTGQLLNTSLVRATKKELVRAHTFLTQKTAKLQTGIKR